MKLRALRTPRVQPHDDFYTLVDQNVPPLKEHSVLAISSKIISLCQGRVIPKDQVSSKEDLVEQEAEFYLPASEGAYGCAMTIKWGVLIPNAGIDESNAHNHYVLYPGRLQETLNALWHYLRHRDGVHHLGVVATDSHTTPLRWGTTGISLGWCGFEPLRSYIHKPDCFGRLMHFSKANLVDGLAAAAVLVMGEGDEQTPLVLIEDITGLVFQDRPPTEEELISFRIPMEQDLYAPLLQHVKWRHREKS